jgi:hypothetical protein
MMTGLGLSVVVSIALGALLLWLLWPRGAAASARPLIVALGAGLGAGLSGVLLFAWMLAFGPSRGFPVAEAALLSVVALLALRRRHAATSFRPVPPAGSRRSRLLLMLGLGFVVTLAAAIVAFAAILRQHPHGEWDAWMNWDLRARMFFRGGEEWRQAFSATFPWSHPDYPPLVPSLVARSWLYAGRETLLGPALVAGTFTFAIVALLVTALAVLRSASQGLLAGLVLLSTPFFILHGTALYADVPLAFFFLATFVCLALDERHGAETGRFAVLAGMSAGVAMWTKNEGLLFTLSLGAGLLLAGWRGDRPAARRHLRAFATGLLPFLILVATFKIAFAPANDLLSTLGMERTLGRLTAPGRYFLVVREYTYHIASFGANGFGSAVWVLTAYFLALGVSPVDARRQWVRTGAIALAVLLAGHFMVFVSMADELARLLDSSLDRLLLQVWPSALLLFFLAVRTPEEAGSGSLAAGDLANEH